MFNPQMSYTACLHTHCPNWGALSLPHIPAVLTPPFGPSLSNRAHPSQPEVSPTMSSVEHTPLLFLTGMYVLASSKILWIL